MSLHKMTLTDRSPTGAQTWTCPACGYSVVVAMNGRYIPLVNGDIAAKHVAGVNGNISLDLNANMGDVWDQIMEDLENNE